MDNKVKQPKFTPGPWRLAIDNNTEIVNARGFRIASTESVFNIREAYNRFSDHWANIPGVTKIDADEECAEADAQLIAAAPNLFNEHHEWAMLFGNALVKVLQEDFDAIRAIAKTAKIIFPDGAPMLDSPAISKALGQEAETNG